MKKNIPLIIAACIPVVMIIVVALIVYIPRLTLNPQYDFLYVVDNQHYQSNGFYYVVTDGKVIQREIVTQNNTPVVPTNYSRPQLYIFDTETNTSRGVSLEELENTIIDSHELSPDEFHIENNRGHNGIFELFGSRNSRDSMILQKGSGAGIPITLQTVHSNYYNVDILGWIINQ